MCPNFMVKIRHDLAIDLLLWISDGNHSTGSRTIPYCLLMNWLVGHPNPFRKRFDSSARISRVAAKVRPHED